MTDHAPRLFTSDAAIVRIGEGLLDRSLPRADWTHEAHLGATLYLLTRRADIDLDRELPDIIRRFNAAVGGVNSDTEGYHETITRTYLAGVRHFLSSTVHDGLMASANGLLLSEIGRRDWPLRFYSRERLFSVEARLAWIEPDLAALPYETGPLLA